MLINDVVTAFRKVLVHRKIQAELSEIVPTEWGVGKQFSFVACGKTYAFTVHENNKYVNVMVQYMNNEDPWPQQFFGDRFLKSTPDSIRKSALIFRKKLEMKPVYDLLQA